MGSGNSAAECTWRLFAFKGVVSGAAMKRKFEGNELKYIKEVLDSGKLSARYGDMAHRFEQTFAERMGAKYAIAVNSGTSALFVALKACGIGPGDEVIVPCLGPTMTAAAVVHAGATPVFADIDPETYCVTEDTVYSVASLNAKAVIPVHIFGNNCCTFTDQTDFVVIEDCAQSLSPRQGGDIACYSMEQSKHICCGDGGMVTTNEPELAKLIRQWSDHGNSKVTAEDGRWRGQAEFDFPGYNFRMPEVVAAVGLAQLETAKGGLLYRAQHVYKMAVTNDADEYENYLKSKGIEFARAPWGKLVYQWPMFGAQKGLCPVAEEIFPNLFIFPVKTCLNI